MSEVVSLQDEMVCGYMDLVEDQWYHHHYHNQARQSNELSGSPGKGDGRGD